MNKKFKLYFLILIFSCLISCSQSAVNNNQKSKVLYNSNEKLLINKIKDISKVINRLEKKCSEGFSTHQKILSYENIDFDGITLYLNIIDSCIYYSDKLYSSKNNLREIAVNYIKNFKEELASSANIKNSEIQKNKISEIIQKYASLMASLKIGQEEFNALITPLIIHGKYIKKYNIPDDKDTLLDEKNYVHKAYNSFIKELDITKKEISELLIKLEKK